MGELEFQRELGASFLCVKRSLKDNLVSIKELKTVLQCLGLSPSDDDVGKIFKEKGLTFEEYCILARKFSEFSEEYINGLFSKCIQVNSGNMKMTEFVRAFGPLSKVSDTGNSVTPTDKNFSNDDTINLTSVIANITKVSTDLRELSTKRYDKLATTGSLIAPRKDLINLVETKSIDVDIKSWKAITLKGSFFTENDTIIAHQYTFTVSGTREYAVVIKQKFLFKMYSGDSLAFLFKEENGERSYVGHTNSLTKDLYPVCICSLTAGKYVLIPYSTGFYSANIESATQKEIQLVELNPNVILTNNFVSILKDIFNQVDLDGNNLLSRQEFNLYNWRTSGDIVEDEEWQAVVENFNVVDGELSPSGFISLHQLEADDCLGKTDDLWLALEAMGYNKQGDQVQSMQFEVSVLCDSETPNLTVSGLRSGGALIETAFIESIIESSTPTNIAYNKDILVYKNLTSKRGTIIIKNMSEKKYIIRIDCSSSINCLSHRQNLNVLLEIEKHECIIAHHLFPRDKDIPLETKSKENIHR